MLATLDLKFGDGDYTFALPVTQLLELQRLCGAGIFTIYGRVLKGRYILEGGLKFGVPGECEAHALDVYETIRLGLIGGNSGLVNGQQVTVNANRARELVEIYAHPPVPLKEAWDVAAAILFAAIEGHGEDDQKKSPEPVEAKASTRSTKRKSSRTAQ